MSLDTDNSKLERQKRSKQLRWIIGIGAVVLIGILAYSSYEQTHKKYEVCMTFQERTYCEAATGSTPDEAIRAAQGADCQMVTSGRDELMACMDMQPTRVREVK